MITPEILVEKASNTSTAYHKYMLKKNGTTLFCFTEGVHDPDYYMDKVRCIYGDDFLILDCQGKDKVIGMYGKIYQKDKDRQKLAFFIDKDFDLPLNNPDIFETDCYSIENYYCTPSAFERILQYGFKVKTEQEFQEALSFYSREFCAFHQTVDLFNAFYSLLHQYERKSGIETKLNLGETFDTNLATIAVGGCRKSYDLSSLFAKYSIPTDAMTSAEVENERRNLINGNPFQTFRGKYEIEFLWKLLNHLVQDANHAKTIIKKKVSLNLNGKTFMADFSQYADIPDSLRSYLAKFKN